jgi:hypothetical protein
VDYLLQCIDYDPTTDRTAARADVSVNVVVRRRRGSVGYLGGWAMVVTMVVVVVGGCMERHCCPASGVGGGCFSNSRVFPTSVWGRRVRWREVLFGRGVAGGGGGDITWLPLRVDVVWDDGVCGMGLPDGGRGEGEGLDLF